jgi:hypothetical protein
LISENKELGPIGLVAVLIPWLSSLSAGRMWTGLTARLQSNLASSSKVNGNGKGRHVI